MQKQTFAEGLDQAEAAGRTAGAGCCLSVAAEPASVGVS